MMGIILERNVIQEFTSGKELKIIVFFMNECYNDLSLFSLRMGKKRKKRKLKRSMATMGAKAPSPSPHSQIETESSKHRG
mmetsp:Transcript_1818/g.2614  ORF Transcript_1818/g.2614 Transcript_1818/m.2614 type:complete len:80 (+) Transcript_1818:299-538(+)